MGLLPSRTFSLATFDTHFVTLLKGEYIYFFVSNYMVMVARAIFRSGGIVKDEPRLDFFFQSCYLWVSHPCQEDYNTASLLFSHHGGLFLFFSKLQSCPIDRRAALFFFLFDELSPAIPFFKFPPFFTLWGFT